MSVVLAMEETGPCRTRLEVEVPAAAVEAEAGRVVRELAREVRLPGFRRGKVPVTLVERQFPEEIERRVVERLVPRYWKLAEAERELQPLGAPEVAGIEYKAGEPLRFTATVETRPAIELRNIVDFDLPDPAVEPTDEEVAAALGELRHQAADWVPATRSAAHGDRARLQVVELTGDEGGTREPQETEVEIGAPRVWEELSLALVGAEVGQDREFERREGEGENATVRRFRVTLRELLSPVLPELDDAFAARVGKFTTLAELRESIREQLRAARQRERRRQREQALLNQLIERHPLPLPEGVVREETESLMREYAESLALRGVDLQRSEIDWQGIGTQLKPQAERRVHARLLLDAVAEAKELEVPEEEFEAALAALGRSQGQSAMTVRQQLDRSGQLRAFRAQLRHEKALSLMLGETPEA
ncbi:MAG TPA: trigger factor [Thermoanaerobaculia bacterium]|nr:trigger factor [Thermoanaerobaculia bacterium]